MPQDYRKEIMQMIKSGKNPQEVVLNVIGEPMSKTPVGANLISLAHQGKEAEIEQIARNMLAAQGRDFDSEFKAFKKQWGFE